MKQGPKGNRTQPGRLRVKTPRLQDVRETRRKTQPEGRGPGSQGRTNPGRLRAGENNTAPGLASDPKGHASRGTGHRGQVKANKTRPRADGNLGAPGRTGDTRGKRHWESKGQNSQADDGWRLHGARTGD